MAAKRAARCLSGFSGLAASVSFRQAFSTSEILCLLRYASTSACANVHIHIIYILYYTYIEILYIYIHAYIHTYIDTYIHTCTGVAAPSPPAALLLWPA